MLSKVFLKEHRLFFASPAASPYPLTIRVFWTDIGRSLTGFQGTTF